MHISSSFTFSVKLYLSYKGLCISNIWYFKCIFISQTEKKAKGLFLNFFQFSLILLIDLAKSNLVISKSIHFNFLFYNLSFDGIPDCIFFFAQDNLRYIQKQSCIKQNDIARFELWSGPSGRCSGDVMWKKRFAPALSFLFSVPTTYTYAYTTFQLIETCPNNHTSKSVMSSLENHTSLCHQSVSGSV